MNNLEQIEKYLFGDMSLEEKSEFEVQMDKDPGLKQTVNEYSQTFSALKRKWVEDGIKKLNRIRLIKQLAVAGIVVIAVISAIFAFKTNKHHEKASINSIDFEVENMVENSLRDSLYIQTDSTVLLEKNISQSNLKDSSYHPKNFAPIVGVYQPIKETLPTIDSFLFNEMLTYGEIEDSAGAETTFNPLIGVKWQTFTLDNTKNNRITLLGGTVLDIGSGILSTENGENNLKEVKLRVKEFLNYYDLWQEGIHTSSNGQQLITAGSCLIEAESHGQKVNVKPEGTFTIQFPGKENPSNTIFYGSKSEEKGFNWIEGGSDLQIFKDNNYNNFYGEEILDDESFGKTKSKFSLSDTIWFFETEVMDEGLMAGKYNFHTLNNLGVFEEVFNPLCSTKHIDIKSMFLRKENLLMRFHLDSTGYMDRFDYNFKLKRKAEKEMKKNASSLIGNTKINVQDFKFKERIVNVTLLPNFRIENKDSILTDSSLMEMETFQDGRLAYNAIVSSQFGYINCDRFAYYNEKINMNVHSEIGKLQDVRVFFLNENSVMNSQITGIKASIQNIPLDQPILIIGINQTGNQMFILETTTANSVKSGKGEAFDALKVKNILTTYR
ncbi:MAG: hypothetical protein R2852_08510 [Bacteroidia bacterium]